MHNRESIAQGLQQITIELKNEGMWQDALPSVEALSSTQPFCCDTLRLEQWLQFIFIPKMTYLLNEGAQLPTNVAITPIAEEVFVSLKQGGRLLDTIKQIDNLLSGTK